MDVTINLTVNGRQQAVTTDPTRPLLDVLREDLGLTGAKYGCGEGRCGACAVLIDGSRTFSCRVPVESVQDKQITTIEGLADHGSLTAVQEAFMTHGAFQCGYCTPGMIMAATALLELKDNPDDEEILSWMNPQLCRCCGYPAIIDAVRSAAAMRRAQR
jgi:aerobic carbon-monoxide dehydrogenase small subunit